MVLRDKKKKYVRSLRKVRRLFNSYRRGRGWGRKIRPPVNAFRDQIIPHPSLVGWDLLFMHQSIPAVPIPPPPPWAIAGHFPTQSIPVGRALAFHPITPGHLTISLFFTLQHCRFLNDKFIDKYTKFLYIYIVCVIYPRVLKHTVMLGHQPGWTRKIYNNRLGL